MLLSASLIKSADSASRAQWSYQKDPEGLDTWRSYYDNVMASRPWQGDCDDLTSTVLDLLSRGMPENLIRLYRLWVCTDGTGKADHMIGVAKDDAGMFWIIGDTAGPATTVHPPYGFVAYERLDNIYSRYKGAPWN